MNEAPSQAFDLLHERIRRFIWQKGWGALREAQELAIPQIVNCDRDVIIAAATAAGKTEAAFLPALTHLLEDPARRLIVYISPLKALINDQFGRLDALCEDLEVPVWPWHGDIGAAVKQRFMKQRHGVVLITPESLEAMLCRRGSAAASLFAHTTCFIVDELHAFIGSERGKQMQSLLHRIELLMQRPVPRIGLSATLGDMNLAAQFLRPAAPHGVHLIHTRSSGGELRILVRGIEQKKIQPVASMSEAADVDEDDSPEVFIGAAQSAIAAELMEVMYGSSNLIFPNSRRDVETYTYLLKRLCEQKGVPICFWPHHGSLSKQIREETEAALKQGERPATGICTSTLELGIDIGPIKAVGQIGPPPAVSSLRQRLGRSGRRPGEPSILRGFAIADELDERSSIPTQMRIALIEMIAMIDLLLEGWCEPPSVGDLHLSTLVQQVLACIAQYGGCSAADLHTWLCGKGAPFESVSVAQFKQLLRHLGEKEVLMQESDGTLLHGKLGEQIVNHYSFYAAFAADVEFRVVAGTKTLGTLPLAQMLTVDQRILFAGRTWRIESIDESSKTIFVVRQSGGQPPMFSGGAGELHARVRQKMRHVLAGTEVPAYLDAGAGKLLAQARKKFRELQLDAAPVVDCGATLVLVVWDSDAVAEGLTVILRWLGVGATRDGAFIDVERSTLRDVELGDLLGDLATATLPTPGELFAGSGNLERQKWDWLLPEPLLHDGLLASHVDLAGAQAWARAASDQLEARAS